MRKSIVLALALVLAVAGASFAATVDWEGEFNATAESNKDKDKFFDKYEMKADLDLTFTIKEDQGVWDAEFTLADVLAELELGKYRVNVNETGYSAVVWGNYGTGNIGHVKDALDLVVIDGRNDNPAPKFRVTSDALGFDFVTQLQGDKAYVNGSTDLDDVKLGATLEHTFSKEKNRVALYGGVGFDGINVDGAFALDTEEDKDNDAYGVKVSADVIEQLNVSGSYRAIGENFKGTDTKSGYDVGATYTEGVLRASAKYDVATAPQTKPDDVTTITVKGIYRGSEDNVTWDDLFKNDKYYTNVAFAAAAEYVMKDGSKEDPASKIVVQATTPVIEDALWAKAQVTASSDKTGFELKQGEETYSVTEYTEVDVRGYYKAAEKWTLQPVVTVKNWEGSNKGDSLTAELEAKYAVAEDATVSATIGQNTKKADSTETVERYTKFGLTVKF